MLLYVQLSRLVGNHPVWKYQDINVGHANFYKHINAYVVLCIIVLVPEFLQWESGKHEHYSSAFSKSNWNF